MIAVFFVNLISVILSLCAKDRRFKLCFLLAFIILTLFYGLRYDYGNDYWGYYESFKASRILDFSQAKEPGWHLLMHIFQPIGYFGFIFTITAVGNIIVYRFIKRNVSRQWWWMAIFVFLFTFNFFLLGLSMMRQYFAMLICIVAVDKYLTTGKIFKYSMLIGIAFTIHFSSIVMMLCLIFNYIRPNVRGLMFTLMFILLVLIMTFATDNMSNSVQFILQTAFMENYSVYSDWDEGKKSVIKITFDTVMLYLVMRSYPEIKRWQIFYLIYLFSFLVLPFTYSIVIITRLMLYFSIFSIVCYPIMCEKYKAKWFFIPFLLILMLYTLHLTMGSFTSETYSSHYMVYRSIFSAPYWL